MKNVGLPGCRTSSLGERSPLGPVLHGGVSLHGQKIGIAHKDCGLGRSEGS
jgi:hypothetical protein